MKPSHASRPREYSLTLKVKYETRWGYQIAVLGSINQLGKWDVNYAYKMRWTEGHIWVADDIRIKEEHGDPTYFMYKYTLLHDGRHAEHEKGLDRIADLKLLKEQRCSSDIDIEMVDPKSNDQFGNRRGNKILYDDSYYL